MNKLLVFIPIFLFFGCSTRQISKANSSNSLNEILSIEEHTYAYYIKAMNQNTQQQINIISYKDIYFDKYQEKRPFLPSETTGVKNIIKGSNNLFKLTEMRFNVNSMEQLGAYIIIENDTIWQGKSTVRNRFYKSENSVGLKISE